MPHTNSKNGFNHTKFKKKSSTSSISNRSRRPQAVVYDENDRYTYLTGFSARKKASKVAAQERASERARLEKLEFRRQLKEVRMSKIKETIEQQAEWYGVDAFADMETHDDDSQIQAPRRVEHIIENHPGDFNDEDQMNTRATRTTVTVEPLEIDHAVLINSNNKTPKRGERNSQRSQNHHQLSTNTQSFNSRSSTNNSNDKRKSSNHKNNKKKKIPYESKATRSIEKAKKKSKRESKSKKR